MKRTLLQLVQNIASAMDSDVINSITDNTEAMQIATCVQTAYFDIATIGELPRDNDIFQLVASGSSSFPVTMTIPSDCANIDWIKYDTQTLTNTAVNYQPVYPMELMDFITMVTNMNSTATNVTAYSHPLNGNTFTLYCNNDRAPRYYTTTDDNTILFDSYDRTVDSTLQTHKTMVFGQKTFPWTMADNFVPPLDDKQHQRLLHEAKALAFAELKQTPHMKAEKMARDIKIDQQASKHKIGIKTDYDLIPNFGRRGPVGRIKPNGRYK